MHGVLDLTFTPAGTGGFDDLRRSATLRSVGRIRVRVAALEDVIRSKQTAGRRKDLEALPELYRLAGRTADAPQDKKEAQKSSQPAAHRQPGLESPRVAGGNGGARP